jgi:hypothetical protein
MSIDLKKLDKTQLRNMLVNARNKDRGDIAQEVLRELRARGLAERRDYDFLEWNQDRVKGVMKPFAEISSGVTDNSRTTYTEAGGLKIGRPAGHPERMWIDSYTAIKTRKMNAVFVCYVRQPGDHPYFELQFNGKAEKRYTPADLEDALVAWRDVASRATAS